MNTCPECGKTADDADALREWFWLRRGEEGFWTCSRRCLVGRIYHVYGIGETEHWLPKVENENGRSE